MSLNTSFQSQPTLFPDLPEEFIDLETTSSFLESKWAYRLMAVVVGGVGTFGIITTLLTVISNAGCGSVFHL